MKNRILYFFGHYGQREIGEMYGRCRSTAGVQIRCGGLSPAEAARALMGRPRRHEKERYRNT